MTFRHPVKQALLASFSAFNRYPASLGEKNEILSLIKTLWPVECGRELIRLGPDSDGGYLVPNDLADISACFSPGVSTTSGFEKEIADRGIKVFLADASVEKPEMPHALFKFTKRNLGANSTSMTMTLEEWIEAEVGDTHNDLLLQMDIEGCEFETLLATPVRVLKKFRIIVLEVHHLDHLWSRHFFSIAKATFQRLLSTHRTVHIHPNNCANPCRLHGLSIPPVMEFTFLRDDRFLMETSYRQDFPHRLDRDNTSNPPIELPRIWTGTLT